MISCPSTLTTVTPPDPLLSLNPIRLVPHFMVLRTATPPLRWPRQYRPRWHPATGRPWAGPAPEGWGQWRRRLPGAGPVCSRYYPRRDPERPEHWPVRRPGSPAPSAPPRPDSVPHRPGALRRTGYSAPAAENARPPPAPGPHGGHRRSLWYYKRERPPEASLPPAGDGRAQRQAQFRPAGPALAPAPRHSR